MAKKVSAWWAAHKPSKRRLIQVYAALLYNAHIKGYIKGDIYTGHIKNFCVPGFNCYSCPGAIGACPLGALQNALASMDKRAPWYVLGILLLYGLMVCVTRKRRLAGAISPANCFFRGLRVGKVGVAAAESLGQLVALNSF